jgi:hypothetical protein
MAEKGYMFLLGLFFKNWGLCQNITMYKMYIGSNIPPPNSHFHFVIRHSIAGISLMWRLIAEIHRNETKFTETKRNRNEIDRNETKQNNSK